MGWSGREEVAIRRTSKSDLETSRYARQTCERRHGIDMESGHVKQKGIGRRYGHWSSASSTASALGISEAATISL